MRYVGRYKIEEGKRGLAVKVLYTDMEMEYAPLYPLEDRAWTQSY